LDKHVALFLTRMFLTPPAPVSFQDNVTALSPNKNCSCLPECMYSRMQGEKSSFPFTVGALFFTCPLRTLAGWRACLWWRSAIRFSGMVQNGGVAGNRLCHGCVSRAGRKPRHQRHFHSRLTQPWHNRVLPGFEPCPFLLVWRVPEGAISSTHFAPESVILFVWAQCATNDNSCHYLSGNS
jgi:hypothetical protein